MLGCGVPSVFISKDTERKVGKENLNSLLAFEDKIFEKAFKNHLRESKV